MKPSLKRKVCSTNVIESCDKEKIHLLQPCNRIFIVLTSCLRLFWLSLHSWPSRRFTHSFFTIFLLKPPCLIARGFIFLSFFKRKINARTLTFMDSCQATYKKKPQLFLLENCFMSFFMKQKSRFMFFMLSRRI